LFAPWLLMGYDLDVMNCYPLSLLIAKVGPDETLYPPLIVAGGVLLSLTGIAFACLCVWKILRWISQRDDPRHAKRPPDPP
jgi:hypothetical protein